MPEIIDQPVSFHFLTEKPEIDKWDNLAPFFDEIKSRDLSTKESLVQALKDLNELYVHIGEKVRWIYIRMSCDTEDKESLEEYKNYLTNIQPNLSLVEFEIEKLLLSSPAIDELETEHFGIYVRNTKNQQQLFREENIPIIKELGLLEKEYGQISGKMTIEIDGKEKPLSAAQQKLRDADRSVRKEYFEKVNHRRMQDATEINDLFDKLYDLRTQIAKNSGFDNFRDYKFRSMNRFDYTPEDCFTFHNAIEAVVMPRLEDEHNTLKEKLKLDVLRPYDLDADPDGKKPSTPFTDTKELVDKTIQSLNKVNPFFGDCLRTMNERGTLDLDARKGKAPGGYNMSLPLSGGAFIFMNASGSERDVKTMIHEAGHAVHSFLMDKQDFNFQQSITSEVAELASMSMELFTMDYWDVFYTNADDLKTAKKNHLKGILNILPWVATVDAFQHAIYTLPKQSYAERNQTWLKVFKRFSPELVDWTGYEDFKANSWQKQLHLFQVPFYYIEYAMAQLGAVAMWKQYKENPQQAIDNYINALSLGNTTSIPDTYSAAGIKFDFTKSYLEELISFLVDELEKVS